jgi:hypothetical protein
MLNRPQFSRRTAAAVAGLALAATGLGIAGALQSTAATSQPAAAGHPVLIKSITIKGDKINVNVRTKAILRGKTTGIARNTVVQVERLENKKWVKFPAMTLVNRDGTYSVAVLSGRVGLNEFRVVAAKAVSPVQFINVTK